MDLITDTFASRDRDDQHDDDSSGSSSDRATTRLNKVIADSGLVSRRAADRLIEEGSVTVNGKKVYELGVRVDPKKDKIIVGGKPLKHKGLPIYALFHKPKGVLTTMEDPLGRPTVKDFLEDMPARVFPVGRLDWDSEGLLLLTNDGEWAQKIMNPKSEITKTYLVKVDGSPTNEHLNKLRRGVSIPGGKVKALHVSRIKKAGEKKSQYDWLKIVITEGKNRQIRYMFEKIGFDVQKLQRVAIGRLRIGNVDRGQVVYLNDVAAKRVFQQDLYNDVTPKVKVDEYGFEVEADDPEDQSHIHPMRRKKSGKKAPRRSNLARKGASSPTRRRQKSAKKNLPMVSAEKLFK